MKFLKGIFCSTILIVFQGCVSNESQQPFEVKKGGQQEVMKNYVNDKNKLEYQGPVKHKMKVYFEEKNMSKLPNRPLVLMEYGVKNNKGYFVIYNKEPNTIRVDVSYKDKSLTSMLIKPNSNSETKAFNPRNPIAKWEVTDWTTIEKLETQLNNGIRFGWRSFKGKQQFRFHNATNKTLSFFYYYKQEGESSKKHMELPSRAASQWFDYPGGDIITLFAEKS
jgi:hypothetical protein